MSYPVPKDAVFYSLIEQAKDLVYSPKTNQDNSTVSHDFSWEEKNPLVDSYLSFISEYKNLFRSIPFIKAIYLANSLTFNALHEDSDIDLVVICDKKRLWLVRAMTVFTFQLLWIRRYKRDISKKFCLSFYVTQDNVNLLNIALKPYDIYLAYRIRHLVPLYEYQEGYSQVIYKENSWLGSYFSRWIPQQTVFLGNELWSGATKLKRFLEYFLLSPLWDVLNFLIKLIWLPIVLFKRKRQWDMAWGVVVSDTMLKFHWNDIRKKVNIEYKVFQKYRD